MNFMESEEYSQNLRDGDLIRKKIQKYKKQFDQIRKVMRQKQDYFDNSNQIANHSTEPDEIDIESRSEGLTIPYSAKNLDGYNTRAGSEMENFGARNSDCKTIVLDDQDQQVVQAYAHLHGISVDQAYDDLHGCR